MKQGSLRSSAYAVLTAFIWGTAFVAQSVGAEHVPPLAFNAARSVIAFVFLLVLCAVMRSGRRRKGQAVSVTRSRKDLLLGGFWCGLTLGLASFLQQKGSGYHFPRQGGLHHRPLHRAGAHFRHFPEEAEYPRRCGSVCCWR